MPAALLLDKSYLDGAPSASIATLCQDHAVLCSETLFYELMTTRPESQVRCFSKLPSRAGSFSLLPNVGALLRAEMETRSPCGPLGQHVMEGTYIFHPNLRAGTYVPTDEILTTLESWKRQVAQDAKTFLDLCQSVHQFFPELVGIEFRDFSAAVAAARSRVGSSSEVVRAVYATFSREDLPPKAPLPADINPEWAWFRRIQCQLLAALRMFERYQCRVPTDPTPAVLERAEHSMHDMEYVILASLAGAIASNDAEVIDDFRLVSPGGTLVTTLAR